MRKRKQNRPIPDNIRERCKRAKQYLRKLEECENGFCTCISCGKTLPFYNTTAGHYIPQYILPTEIENDNIWPQCEYCNRVLQGNLKAYRSNLINKIGLDRVVRLETIYRAYRGNKLAEISLSFEDQELLHQKRNKLYYMRNYSRIMNKIKEFKENPCF